LRYSPADKFAAVQWVEGDYGYVVSGPAERERLLKIAETVYAQMEQRPPAGRTDAGPLISRRGS
jgi:anti-sigma factor RsiW